MRLPALTLAASLAAFPLAAHDGEDHGTKAEALEHLSGGAASAEGAATPFPIILGGSYALTDQHGRTRTEADPDGRAQLLFFGYATCQAICTVALPRMAEIAALTAEAGVEVTPVMITVDPARDTPETMASALAEHHPAMIGLTGDDAALAAAYDAFQVEKKVVFEDPELGPVYAHGSFIYLLSSSGKMLTLMPPIIDPARGAEIVAKYLAAEG